MHGMRPVHPGLPGGALQLIDGKARLVSDLFCDGLGACIGTCPEGAISVIEREAAPYDERAVMATIVKQGQPVIKAHLEHLAGHGQVPLYDQAIEYLIENGIPIPDHTAPAGRSREIHSAGSNKEPGLHAPASGVCHPGPHEPHPFSGCPAQRLEESPELVAPASRSAGQRIPGCDSGRQLSSAEPGGPLLRERRSSDRCRLCPVCVCGVPRGVPERPDRDHLLPEAGS